MDGGTLPTAMLRAVVVLKLEIVRINLFAQLAVRAHPMHHRQDRRPSPFSICDAVAEHTAQYLR